jgi:NADH-quinone oxidoreductase subunit M
VILSAVYMLWMFQRVFYGEVTHEANVGLPDLQPREWAGVVPRWAAAHLKGVLPLFFLKPMEPAVQRVVERIQLAQPVRVQQAPAAPAAAGGK